MSCSYLSFVKGDAIIIPTVEGKENMGKVDWAKYNEGQPINYLVSAPTMRVPQDVYNTPNAYLAFRAVILAGTCWLCNL